MIVRFWLGTAALVSVLVFGGCTPDEEAARGTTEEAGPVTDLPDEGFDEPGVDAGDPITDPDGLGEGGGIAPDSTPIGRQ